MQMKIYIDGVFYADNEAKISVFDHGLLYGDGVFEGIRVYSGKIFECQAHMDRLFESARKIRLEIPYTKEQLVAAQEQAIAANACHDAYIRLVVTRGEGGLGLNPNKCARPNVFIIADNIQLYPPELYETGMPVIIARTIRTSATMLDPSVKSLNYLNNILCKIECNDAGVSEAIMLNDKGNVAECSGDNIFLVEAGKLITPPPTAGILLGVTRAVVMKLARKMGIDVLEKDFKPAELFTADEMFLTGSGAEIISVTHVDGKTIGQGKSGPITQKLLHAFREYIRQ
jgi:branched-chain amino acid aminotransferase